MKIETKFNRGETVFYMSGNSLDILSITIHKILIKITDHGVFVEYKGALDFVYKEVILYKTKEECKKAMIEKIEKL